MAGRIVGIGGIFVKSENKQQLSKWYKDIFEIKIEDWGTTFAIAENSKEEMQVFSIFPNNTSYMNPTQIYMINWMVDNLDLLLEKLKIKEVEILGVETSEFGKFAWIHDLDGNKLELWEPPKQLEKNDKS